jgi:hypothetical protein
MKNVVDTYFSKGSTERDQ